MSIHYRDGRTYNIHYERIWIPTEFEPRYPKGESSRRGGWFCPKRGCCSR